ncbi:MAG: MgtC/SapB family protein [Oscillospiraceae bacterium]|nr:MgtC/SapB family protein [Oscillospiraceae bacterium]
MDIWQYLGEFNMASITFRLVLAMVFGGIVGFERGSKRRAAGFRTYMLVCVGSALVMITSQYISLNFPLPSDPARLGAQVISGIGFLGAGTIIVTSYNQVKGLTTAAGLWASACLGLAIGIGFYQGAIVAGVIILFVITVLQKIDTMLIANSRSIELYVEFNDGERVSNLLSFANQNSIRILNVAFTRSKFNKTDTQAALISMRLPKRYPHNEIVEKFAEVEGVFYIEEI